MIGERIKSNQCGWFTVVEQIRHPKGIKYRVEFDEINGVKYSTIRERKHVLTGSIKNPYYPLKLGVASIGEVNTKQYPLEYNRWRAMIERCYDDNHIHYQNYGGRGVTVCERWLCFENFLEDIKNLKGYDEDRLSELQLDKDFIGNGRLYSPENCMLVSLDDNMKEMNKRKSLRRNILMENNYTYSAMLLADFYKLSHRPQYPNGTEVVYSTWTPRKSRVEGVNHVVAFNIQGVIKKYLIRYFNAMFFGRPKVDVVNEYKRIVSFTLGAKIDDIDTSHIEELHDLGYLPIKIKAVKEGTLVPMRVPMMTIENTDPRFFWLTNFLETLLSSELWQPMTSATLARKYYEIGAEYADRTVGNRDHLPFQFHDFSFRGMGSLDSAMSSGAGHLLSFVGTDTIPAILFLEDYYNANVENELVGTSIPATEHSVMSANADSETLNEFESYKRLITEIYPQGFVSIVSDTYDFWNNIGDTIPRLKQDILSRDGKVVIRPDSGDPVKILVGDEDATESLAFGGLIEALWSIFGGTVNELGYKVLDPHIGAIYGDSITPERAVLIFEGLKRKGFASSNVVLGVGSFSFQMVTRDTYGFAMKCTYTIINGEERLIYKDPKTDDGTKRSQRGLVAVLSNPDGEIGFIDGLDKQAYAIFEDVDLLEDVFVDGELVREQTLSEIRELLTNQ